MTAVTPGREALPALAMNEAQNTRAATIEECAQVAFSAAFSARTMVRGAKGRTERLQAVAAEETAQQIYKTILALSTTGKPKP